MFFQDGGVPALLAGGPGGAICEIGQLTIVDHPVQGLGGDAHLRHEILHGDNDFVSISIFTHFISIDLQTKNNSY